MKVLNLCLYLLLHSGKKRHEITITSSFYLLFDLNMCNYNKKKQFYEKKRVTRFLLINILKLFLKTAGVARSCDFLLIFEIHDFDSSIRTINLHPLQAHGAHTLAGPCAQWLPSTASITEGLQNVTKPEGAS